jgi:hypothetical protein
MFGKRNARGREMTLQVSSPGMCQVQRRKPMGYLLAVLLVALPCRAAVDDGMSWKGKKVMPAKRNVRLHFHDEKGSTPDADFNWLTGTIVEERGDNLLVRSDAGTEGIVPSTDVV